MVLDQSMDGLPETSRVRAGALLRTLVLVPRRLTIADAARLLGVDAWQFGDVIRGRRAVSGQLAARLEHVFGVPIERLRPGLTPATLAVLRDGIRRAGLSRYRVRLQVPDNRFGKTLALIIGGTTRREAANRLGLDLGELSRIIAGKRRVTRQFVVRHDMPARLAARFPEGWARHGDALMAAHDALPATRGPRRRRLHGEAPSGVGAERIDRSSGRAATSATYQAAEKRIEVEV